VEVLVNAEEVLTVDRLADRPGTWVGRSVLRVEDPRLLTGRCQFVDDVNLPDMLHASVFRSTVPHARIRSLDVSAAREFPGVSAVITAADLDAMGIGGLPVSWVVDGQKARSFPILAPRRCSTPVSRWRLSLPRIVMSQRTPST
jgi:CO/xanthine dehydrogenase Mo-binding subunit